MIQVADNFDHKSKKPLDARTSYATLALMKAVTDANINEGCLAYCAETDKYYKFLSTNTVDADTGKWREFNSGGGGGGGTNDYSDLSNKPKINNVTLSGNKTSAQLGLANAPTVTSQTLTAGQTTVTFSGMPNSGDNLIDFFTSNGVNYTAITISGSTVVLTYPVQSSDITVYCRIEGV